jgi:hypothetical protein
MKTIVHDTSGWSQPGQRLLPKKSAFLLTLALALSAWTLQVIRGSRRLRPMKTQSLNHQPAAGAAQL